MENNKLQKMRWERERGAFVQEPYKEHSDGGGRAVWPFCPVLVPFWVWEAIRDTFRTMIALCEFDL